MITTAQSATPAAGTIQAALAWAVRRLAAHSDSPRLDAEVLLAHVIGRPRAHLLAHPEMAVPSAALDDFHRLIARRARCEPVAYLTGWREFWSRRFRVTPATLVPRPETEILVELALERLPAGAPRRIADLGTGSGAIALALALERPSCTVVATDVSAAALDVARDNAQGLGAANVEFRCGDWCAALDGKRFDLIVSNPPYVGAGDPHLRRGELRFEPLLALASGAGGLDAIRQIAAQARTHLARHGWLMLEHGFDQAGAVAVLLRRHGYSPIEHRADISGHSRVVAACYEGDPSP